MVRSANAAAARPGSGTARQARPAGPCRALRPVPPLHPGALSPRPLAPVALQRRARLLARSSVCGDPLITCAEPTLFFGERCAAAKDVPPSAMNSASSAIVMPPQEGRMILYRMPPPFASVEDLTECSTIPSCRRDVDGRPRSSAATMSRVSQLSPRPEPEPDFRDYEPIHPEPGWKSLARKIWAPLAACVGLAVKFSFFAFKFLGLFVSVAAYALIWGWKFGVGFVGMILVHELGHFVEAQAAGARRLDPALHPVPRRLRADQELAAEPAEQRLRSRSPGRQPAASPRSPAGRSASATDSSLLHALAYAGFFLNLFNLLPIGILDGGAIWRSYRLAQAEPMVPLAGRRRGRPAPGRRPRARDADPDALPRTGRPAAPSACGARTCPQHRL